MAGSKTTIVGTDDNFEAEVLQSELPVLVDFCCARPSLGKEKVM